VTQLRHSIGDDADVGGEQLAGERRRVGARRPTARSGHFPMYSNPMAMWDRIAEFYARMEPR
jgi:hypothetical protein